jgi:hypothetical protein
MSGVFAVCWHSALQYLPEVAMQVQIGCAHFSVFVESIFCIPSNQNKERMTPDLSIRNQRPLYRKEHISGAAGKEMLTPVA